MDDRIDEMMDEYRTTDFTPVSFVSTKNTQVQEVQFAMKTPDIQKDETVQETPWTKDPKICGSGSCISSALISKNLHFFPLPFSYSAEGKVVAHCVWRFPPKR